MFCLEKLPTTFVPTTFVDSLLCFIETKKYPLDGGASKTEGPDSVQKIPPGGLHFQNMHWSSFPFKFFHFLYFPGGRDSGRLNCYLRLPQSCQSWRPGQRPTEFAEKKKSKSNYFLQPLKKTCQIKVFLANLDSARILRAV